MLKFYDMSYSKYNYIGEFHEGLAGVIDEDYNYYYIDKCGRKKIEIARIYTSLLELGDKYIFIKASSEEELNEIRQVKEELLDNINDLSSNVIDDLYEYKRSKVKK